MSLLVISAPFYGKVDDELSRLVFVKFLETMKQENEIPQMILLMHQGVHTINKESQQIYLLRDFSELGAQIYICKFCFDYYGYKEQDLLFGDIIMANQVLKIINSASSVVYL